MFAVSASQAVYAGSALPKVLIIGDSISEGYTPHVVALLRGEAEVSRIPENGETSAYGLEHMDDWLGSTRWDVISFNFGQWDFCYHNPALPESNDRDKVHGSIAISLDQYKANLEKIVERLQKTHAHLVWENTTFVPEGESGRNVEDAIRYNQAAQKIMQQHGVAVVDLYDLTKGFEPGLFKRPHNVHYSDEGYQKIAVAVAQGIRQSLPASVHRSP
ncbi:SGNH/GDSL hydrolase family protein [Dyella sp. C11]|uniref:SGNH/GDSL hydrolase family protein n=1 Tax=Dyella sp. C11 TaxID=2126991 RepID=UPI0013006139|nr:SGNH/GDSL hydrolase family protein [Dyella sp. C11]